MYLISWLQDGSAAVPTTPEKGRGRIKRTFKKIKLFFSCLFFIIFKIYLFFNWRIIALQDYVGFCQASTWISHWYTCVPSLELSSHLPSHPTPLGCYRAPVWVPRVTLAIYFTYGNVSFHITISVHPTVSFLHSHCVRKSVLCVSILVLQIIASVPFS